MRDTITPAGIALTAAQSAHYWNDGFLYPIRAMSEADAAALHAEMEALKAEWLDNGLPLLLNTYKRINARNGMLSPVDFENRQQNVNQEGV